jgi:RNA 2',3'-cyclic 3'-phosphodiesterase
MDKRIFLGIPIAFDETYPLRIFIESQPCESKIRWIPEHNLHITLAFLGNTDVYQIEKIIERIEIAINSIENFQLIFSHFSVSPKPNPYMVWVQFESNQVFEKLCSQIALSLKLPKPNKLIAHCTLARFKQGFDFSCLQTEQNLGFEINVDRFCLYESKLNTEGAEYTSIHEFILKAN